MKWFAPLIGAGVNSNRILGKESPLVHAIEMEHTAMVDLLISQGVYLDSWGTIEGCVIRAKKDG